MDHVNLFVVGVNKAGTSWLYYLLDHHPDVFMCEEKELFYFGNDYPEKMGAYHTHFPFGEPYRYFGDATPSYCKKAGVARELRAYAPDARVLAIVRDPIDRLYSHFYYHKQLNLIGEDATAEALVGPRAARMRANSHYEELLPVYAEHFGPEQFRVLSLEEANADVPTFWTKLQAFLDLSPVPAPDAEVRPSNATGGKWFRRLYRRTVRPARRHLPGLYRAMLRSDLASAAKRVLLSVLGTAEKEPLPEAVRSELREEFQPTYRYLVDLGFDVYAEALRGRPAPASQ